MAKDLDYLQVFRPYPSTNISDHLVDSNDNDKISSTASSKSKPDEINSIPSSPSPTVHWLSKPINGKPELHDFFDEDPEGWIVSCECQFKINDINDEENKYLWMVSKLGPNQMNFLKDIIPYGSPLYEKGRYKKLCDALINRFNKNAATDRKLHQMRQSIEFRHSLPSNLYRREVEANFKDIDGNQLSFLINKWLDYLPEIVRLAIEPLKERFIKKFDKTKEIHKPLEIEMIHQADRMMCIHLAYQNIHHHNSKPNLKRFSSMYFENKNRNNNHNHNNHHNHHNGYFGRRTPEYICRFHAKYRESATRCSNPNFCIFNSKNQKDQKEFPINAEFGF